MDNSSCLPLLLQGETLISQHSCTVRFTKSDVPAIVFVSNYRLIVKSLEPKPYIVARKLCFEDEGGGCAEGCGAGEDREEYERGEGIAKIPLSFISAIQACDRFSATIRLVDSKDVQVNLKDKSTASEFIDIVSNMSFCSNPQDWFVFSYQTTPCSSSPSSSDIDGWNVYNMVAEYKRLELLGLDSNLWRISSVNENFSLCQTYTKLLVVPSSISDDELLASARFRQNNRFPIITWHNVQSRTMLFRSSQPMVGLLGRRCKEDERLLRTCVDYMGDGRGVVVFDCRSSSSAIVQRYLAGGGRELVRSVYYGIAGA
eukprot:758388-Hanusia_phi.AAC.10